MGIGNRNYREEQWGGGRGAYLSRESAPRLISNPLITGSNRGRQEDEGGRFDELSFSAVANALEVHGRIRARIPVYAATALVWPRGVDEHYAQSFPVRVLNGEFSIRLAAVPRGHHVVKLLALHVNGGTTSYETQFEVDAAGRPNAAELNSVWMFERAETSVGPRSADAKSILADEAVARAPTTEAQREQPEGVTR